MTTDSISIAQHIIAVDGPAAAGKTTTSRVLSTHYGLRYLESGMAYRFMAYAALRRGINLDDGTALVRLYSALVDASGSSQSLFEESRRHADELRSREVSRAVSAVSRLPELRATITGLIRSWARTARGSVVEGRDIGTTVFPTAAAKFFLTAAPDVRAERRWANEGGTSYREILDDILRRDDADSSRKVSPLKPAGDATVIDTSDLTIEEVLSRMTRRCDDAGLAVAKREVDPGVPAASVDHAR
jgi:cytidylate kinase